jgi:hypothetical protein
MTRAIGVFRSISSFVLMNSGIELDRMKSIHIHFR